MDCVLRGTIIANHVICKSCIERFPNPEHILHPGILRQRTSFCGKKIQIPLQPEDTAVLMQQRIVTISGYTATTGSDDQLGLFTKLSKNLRFQVPEGREQGYEFKSLTDLPL